METPADYRAVALGAGERGGQDVTLVVHRESLGPRLMQLKDHSILASGFRVGLYGRWIEEELISSFASRLTVYRDRSSTVRRIENRT